MSRTIKTEVFSSEIWPWVEWWQHCFPPEVIMWGYISQSSQTHVCMYEYTPKTNPKNRTGQLARSLHGRTSRVIIKFGYKKINTITRFTNNKTRRHRHEHTRHTEENQLPEPTRNKNEVDAVTRPTEPYRVKPKNYQYVWFLLLIFILGE